MWFLVAIFVAALVISTFLAPKAKVTNATSGKLSDFSFPRANYGDSVGRVYGTVEVASPNTIWSGDFRSVAITKKVKTGLFSSKRQTIGYKYYIGLDLAVCLGPNFTFRRIMIGNYELWNGCLTDPENVININAPNLFGGEDKGGGFTGQIALYSGAFDQSRDTYLARKVDPNVPAYVGVAHAVFRGCYVGNSTSISAVKIEGSCFTNGLGLSKCKQIMPNGLDANPIEVLYDITCNDWGNLNVDPKRINVPQWREIAELIHAEGNGISLYIANKVQGQELYRRIMEQIAGTVYEDPATGLFELVLIRDDYDIEDLPVLGPENVISVQGFTKMLWSQTYNRVMAKFTDRSQRYKKDVPAIAEDFANIRYQGRARTYELDLEGVYDGNLASDIAARELSNLNVPLYSFDLNISRLSANLRPGQPCLFHWPEYGIESMVIRIRKFGLGTLQDGTIKASVVQDRFSVSKTVISAPSGGNYVAPDYTAKAITEYNIFELPYWLQQRAALAPAEGTANVAVFAKRPGPASVGFNAFIEQPEDDAEVLDSAPYTASATIVNAVERFAGFNVGMMPTLTVNNVVFAAEGEPFRNSTEEGARSGATLFMLNGELMAYETFTANEDGSYVLNNVHRALLDTTYHASEAGTAAFFFNGQEGFIDDPLTIAATAKLYLQDLTGTGPFPAGDAARIDVTPIGRANLPLAPDGLSVAGVRRAGDPFEAGSNPVIMWKARNRLENPTAIELELDAAEADEAGVTYSLDITRNGVSLATVDPILSGDNIPLTTEHEGPILLVVNAKRGELKSFEPAIYPIIVYLEGSLEIDNEVVTIDGQGIVFDEA